MNPIVILQWWKVSLVALFLLGTSALSALHAQVRAFCHLTEVHTEQLKNAVRIVLEADGLLQVDADFRNFVDFAQGFEWRFIDHIPLFLVNARSQVGNFIDISIYPVSHLELTTPPTAEEGVGLDLVVVLYTPGRLRSFSWGENEGYFPWVDEGVRFDLRLDENRQRLIITVLSDRLVEPADEYRWEELLRGRRQVLEAAYEEGQLSLYALNVDLREAFQAIAAVTNARIVVDEAVKHLFSAYLPGQPLEEVLARLAMAYGLNLRRVGDSYLLSESTAQVAATYQLGETERIPLQYLSPGEALRMLPYFLLRYVHLDEEQNALTVTGPPAMIEKVRRDLAVLDQPLPHIAVEVLAVELKEGTELDLGDHIVFANHERQFEVDSPPGEVSYLGQGQLPQRFLAEVEALAERRRVKIRSRATLTVLNGHRAELFIGRQQFIQVLRGFRRQVIELQRLDIGVRLAVRAWVRGEREVLTHIELEISDIVDFDRVTGLPVVATRRAQFTLRVPSGDTVVLGGLVLQQRTRLKRRIPLLSELPLLGKLFCSREEIVDGSELMLFLTPRRLETGLEAGTSEPSV